MSHVYPHFVCFDHYFLHLPTISSNGWVGVISILEQSWWNSASVIPLPNPESELLHMNEKPGHKWERLFLPAIQGMSVRPYLGKSDRPALTLTATKLKDVKHKFTLTAASHLCRAVATLTVQSLPKAVRVEPKTAFRKHFFCLRQPWLVSLGCNQPNERHQLHGHLPLNQIPTLDLKTPLCFGRI